MSQDYQALCQDCLRAPVFSSELDQKKAHQGEILCQCGGDLCACSDCLHIIQELVAGKRGYVGSVTSPVAEWSAHGGASESCQKDSGQ
ncbi:hypothetical protein [Vreelandella alkaliphila]|uniref:Uncharacterized protein n=1 Tax=Vreelandella alkaliphila TaxID=272774 RepID=A0AAJ2S491_9GAMM|nr:hypothetical protein [Halomonas alkaliphila]MDX5979614.1 hypothetical protein [Halomonas alkaliphila]